MSVVAQGVARSSAPLISIRGLRVAFDDGLHYVPVLHGIDLDIAPGEALGMVGESGCGKSVTWLAVLRLLGANARIDGAVTLDGERIDTMPDDRMNTVRGGRIAMIFQDPASSLNPVHRIGTQLVESLRQHREMDGSSARAEALRLLERVRIPGAAARLRSYPHELSGGMNQRVMIAMALAGDPDLLVADEPTTALDVTIQAQILDLLREIRRDTGMAMVLVSHDLGVVSEVCDRVMVLYAGNVVEFTDTQSLFEHPTHPYTQGLLAAMPDIVAPRRRLLAIPGTVPGPDELPRGCAFAARCTHAFDRCRDEHPALTQSDGAGRWHRVACHHLARRSLPSRDAAALCAVFEVAA